MNSPPFYHGPAMLSSTGDELAAELVLNATGERGLPGWQGTARLVTSAPVVHVLGVLGSEVQVTLPDGRRGEAMTVGYLIVRHNGETDNEWTVDLLGVGEPPSHERGV